MKKEIRNQKILKVYGLATEEVLKNESEKQTNNKDLSLFSTDDAKSLAASRRFGKIKELFTRFKEFIKSKGKEKGEEKEKDD